jgi:hypothetical protein
LICVNNGGADPLYSRTQEKAAFETGLDIMSPGNWYWLEYDFAVLLMGIGLVGLIVLII